MYLKGHLLVIPQERKTLQLNTNNIVRIEAKSSYCKLFLLDGKTFIVSSVLKRFETNLELLGFTRTHRSHLVNKSCIHQYNDFEQTINLLNQEEIPVSRRRKKQLIRSINLT